MNTILQFTKAGDWKDLYKISVELLPSGSAGYTPAYRYTWRGQARECARLIDIEPDLVKPFRLLVKNAKLQITENPLADIITW